MARDSNKTLHVLKHVELQWYAMMKLVLEHRKNISHRLVTSFMAIEACASPQLNSTHPASYHRYSVPNGHRHISHTHIEHLRMWVSCVAGLQQGATCSDLLRSVSM